MLLQFTWHVALMGLARYADNWILQTMAGMDVWLGDSRHCLTTGTEINTNFLVVFKKKAW